MVTYCCYNLLKGKLIIEKERFQFITTKYSINYRINVNIGSIKEIGKLCWTAYY